MDRIDGLLPDAGRAMSGSSGSRGSSPTGPALRLDDQVCPHCGQGLQAEFFEFPPALQHKYGKSGEWYYHPCTPECEKKNEQREWELTRRDARIATLRERSGLSKRMRGYTLSNFRPTISNAAGRARVKVDGDLGSERPTEWVKERIFVIVNHRYREALPTVFTSNIGPKDLAEQLGERTASRIIAMCDWISLEGDDYRETAAKERR